MEKVQKTIEVESKDVKSLSTEELAGLQKAIQSLNQVQTQIGGLEAQKHELLHSLTALNEDLSGIQKDLETKYGSVSVDITTGEYTENEDEASKKD
jgi:uncharacterized protein YoxC